MLGAVILLLTTAIAAGAGPWRWPALLVAWTLLGAVGSLVLIPAGRLLRRSGDAAQRPTLFAADYALSHACWLITYPLAGWLAGATTASATLSTARALIAARAWPPHEPDELEHEHHDLDPRSEHLCGAHPGTAAGAWRHVHPYRRDEHHTAWPR